MLKSKDYEVVGIFNSTEYLDQAADELFSHGFDQSSLSVLENEKSIDVQLRKNYTKVDELADKDNVPRSAFFAEENFALAQGAIVGGLMYIGCIVAAAIVIIGHGSISSALVTASAIIILGIFLAKILRKHHNKYIKQQIKKGGLLLWVHLRHKSQKNLVMKILQSNHARNVHLHSIPKGLYQ